PVAASAIPMKNGSGIEPYPPLGGCSASATTELTTGAPAKTIAITTAGDPLAPKARRTAKAPIAPAIPAINDQAMPPEGMVQDAPLAFRTTSGARTAVRK